MDEIVLSAADGRCLCHSRTCASLGKRAEVMMTFGRLGTRWPDALRLECPGQSYLMCAGCWDQTRQVAAAHRPGLVVRDSRPSAGGGGGV
ncbi:MAG TPA: hypothetical protein VIV12_26625 [Streptosporangiaceae bacterium]